MINIFSTELRDGYINTLQLGCPECQTGYVHLQEVEVDSNRRSIRITNQEVTQVSVIGASTVSIVFRGYCEHGHEFSVEFYSHKGQLHVRYHSWTPDTPEEKKLYDLEYLSRIV